MSVQRIHEKFAPVPLGGDRGSALDANWAETPVDSRMLRALPEIHANEVQLND